MIRTEEELSAALDALVARDPALAPLRAAVGPVAPRRRPPGFPGLCAIMIGQQVSTASAAAIWTRFSSRFDPPTPEAILAASEEDLRACGFSAPKIRAAKAIAEAIASGALPLDALGDMPADEAHALLCAVKGIGPWTADVYLLFCLGHPDAFPAGDLALQEAARLGFGLDARPSPKAFTTLAERWRPWRGAAATLLWAYYKVARGRDVIPPGDQDRLGVG
ncbi:Fe-S cluster assembly protein HesB [Alsobacter soli]|uniref:DNA-3-methyladenine glycosylase II n=1 Tax=Alsobacter soli TaxID=2109933 RepID=A0A2T1HTH9_9HYPH|nr:DNA-3-methyladenine glycosylase [Alsobacter soli]PSC04965.1 Fe-S cluster assembly protein HesB [Alsobacter soli]